MTFDGDPKMFATGDGADLLFIDGQPEMDSGLQNAVFLSLFTGPEYWGNTLVDGSKKYVSEIKKIERKTLTNAVRLDAEIYAKNALAWLVADGIAKKVTVTGYIVDVGILGLLVDIEQPEKTVTYRYDVNWSTMAIKAGVS